MLATILTAVLNVLRVLWRAARRVVTTGRWPHFLTGVFFLWYVIKAGPEKILQGVGRALGPLGKAIVFPFVILWKIARFILALPFWILGCLLAGLILFHFTPFGNDHSASFWALMIVGSIALFVIAGWIKGKPGLARWFIGGLTTVCAFALVFIFLALAARILIPSIWMRIEAKYTYATQGSTREGIGEGAKNILGDAYNADLNRLLGDIQRMREAGASPESIKILVEALEKRKAEADRATSSSPIQPPPPTPTRPQPSQPTSQFRSSLSSDTTDFQTPLTSLEIHNERGREIGLYWIDYQGSEVKRTAIPPGRGWSQPTYITHSWVIKDEDGRVLQTVARPTSPVVLKIN
ncbi:MAG: hypothetical protein U1C57_01315 [Candidatus Doudnabacteria bacterium]|nr:hypothetical protein [bacterium]MDZ4243721.1 hypothetical protein [Candidatus Doudnabacteria bacterium]